MPVYSGFWQILFGFDRIVVKLGSCAHEKVKEDI